MCNPVVVNLFIIDYVLLCNMHTQATVHAYPTAL